ncbi:MAG: mechanosensitive ion channel family protein [Gemmatimonadota bacterium]
MKFDLSPAVDRFREIVEGVLAGLPNYGIALLVLLLSFFVGIVAARQVRRWVARTGAQYGVQNLLGIVARVIFGLVGLTLALGVIGLNLAPLVAGVGVVGLVLGIALKDPLENFMAGIVLLIRQPYTAGDRIMTNGIEGTVTEINIRSTIIRTYGGEQAHVPNGAILREPILNRTAYPATRTTIDLRIPYGAELARALDVAAEAVRAHPDVEADPAVEVAVTDFDERGVGLQVRYWTHSLGATVNRASIECRRRLKEAFDREGIAFAPGLRELLLRAAGDERPESPYDGGRRSDLA